MIEVFGLLDIKFPDVSSQNKFYEKYGNDITILKMIQFVEFFRKDEIN